MSTERIDRERAGWERAPRPTGPTGRPLCRWCNQEIAAGSGRRTFCSESCVHEHLMRTDPGYARDQVFKRDRGVCESCGTDTEQLRNNRPHGYLSERESAEHPWCVEMARLGYPRSCVRWGHTLWQADHTVPVIEGGGSCGLENLRTLCVPCHKRATAELVRRLAEQRRLAALEAAGMRRLELEIP